MEFQTGNIVQIQLNWSSEHANTQRLILAITNTDNNAIYYQNSMNL